MGVRVPLALSFAGEPRCSTVVRQFAEDDDADADEAHGAAGYVNSTRSSLTVTAGCASCTRSIATA